MTAPAFLMPLHPISLGQLRAGLSFHQYVEAHASPRSYRSNGVCLSRCFRPDLRLRIVSAGYQFLASL